MQKKILIIEDEFDVAEDLVALLREENFIAISASNGVEGISKVKNFLPDLIICDINMPGINGFMVKEELNKSETFFDIPFIFLTANANYQSFRNGMNLGSDDYLYKPYKAEELLKAINLRIEKRKEIIKKDFSNEVEKLKIENNTIILVSYKGIEKKIATDAICYITASSQYSNIILDTKDVIVSRKPLNYWEDKLSDELFMRIHRSSIINLRKFSELKGSGNNRQILLTCTDQHFNVSRKYYPKLREYLDRISL